MESPSTVPVDLSGVDEKTRDILRAQLEAFGRQATPAAGRLLSAELGLVLDQSQDAPKRRDIATIDLAALEPPERDELRKSLDLFAEHLSPSLARLASAEIQLMIGQTEVRQNE